MCRICLFVGLLLFSSAAFGRAQDKPLDADLKKLQGFWQPVKKSQGPGYVHLEFGERIKDGKDFVVINHAVEVPGSGRMLDVGNAVENFAIRERDEKRVITLTEKNKQVSNITYRFDGDKLIILEGECNIHHKVSLKGEWKRSDAEKKP
jgi:hypothetical protein